jgi:hypothetical protein
MARVILFYRGPGAPPAADVERILMVPSLQVIEHALPRLWLVDAPLDALRATLNDLPRWSIDIERPYGGLKSRDT